ncbi:hypothetical protein Taro_003369 [Colocasia esculenta]|uniref:CCHC-type domain-containing protein n=1 Tax=Colocasia esculenta TaxID=4460 RepID=A0A843TRN0_COLES|nr:hypothetical protein [Colocasia esculenta]
MGASKGKAPAGPSSSGFGKWGQKLKQALKGKGKGWGGRPQYQQGRGRPVVEESQQSTARQPIVPPGYRCYNCNQPGHLIRNCPYAALKGDAIRSRCPALPRQGRGRPGCRDSNRTLKADLILTELDACRALRSRWDAEVTTFVFPWGHMIPSLEDVSRITGLIVYGRLVSGFTYPCYHDLAERLLELPIDRRSSLIPRVALQASLGLHEAGKSAGKSEDEYLERLVRVNRRELVSEPGAEADMDLRCFLVLFLGRLLFATRGDAVHCHFLPLLEDLSEVGGYAWGAAFLAHQFDSLGASERQTSTSGFFPFLQVWAYLHLPVLGRGDLTWPGLVPIARRWDSRRDSCSLGDPLERLQEAIDSYPYLDVVWQPYLGEGDEGQLWLVQACPYFGRSVWLHALNLVLPLHLYLSQRLLGLRQSVVEFPVRDRFHRPGQSFRGLYDTTDWRE